MEKTIKNFLDIEVNKPKFHQHERHISTKNIDINKIIVSNSLILLSKSLLVKSISNISLTTKMLKKFDLYV